MRFWFGLFLILVTSPVFGIDEVTVYELLAPDTHQFAIRYDTAATQPGSKIYYNIIRPGSEASNEKVFDRATGKELPFVLSDGEEVKASGQAEKDTADETKFIKVTLAHPVPENSEYRLRILKTYRDPKSYYSEGGKIIFERSLGVKRNIIILPQNYELIACSVPAIVNLDEAGRIKISMVNDRDDELAVKIVGRKLTTDEQK